MPFNEWRQQVFVVPGLPGFNWFLTTDFRLKSVLQTASLNGIAFNPMPKARLQPKSFEETSFPARLDVVFGLSVVLCRQSSSVGDLFIILVVPGFAANTGDNEAERLPAEYQH